MGSDYAGPLETKQMSLDRKALWSTVDVATAIDLITMCPGVRVGTSSKVEGGAMQKQGHNWILIFFMPTQVGFLLYQA